VELISRVGALVVVAGNKADANGGCIPSSGVEEEVQIAIDLGKPVIPIGLTGHVAKAAWNAACQAPDRYLPGIDCHAELMVLGNPDSSVEAVVATVVTLLCKAERIASARCRDGAAPP
jgi:hypothetical protein